MDVRHGEISVCFFSLILQDYLNDRKDVAHMAMHSTNSASITASAKGQRKVQAVKDLAPKI